jgi:hypothetical protein
MHPSCSSYQAVLQDQLVSRIHSNHALVRSNTGRVIVGTGAGAGLDRAEGAMVLVRIVAVVLSGEFDCEGFLNGEAKVFLTFPRLAGERPSPTRRCAAGVFIAMGVSIFGLSPLVA